MLGREDADLPSLLERTHPIRSNSNFTLNLILSPPYRSCLQAITFTIQDLNYGFGAMANSLSRTDIDMEGKDICSGVIRSWRWLGLSSNSVEDL